MEWSGRYSGKGLEVGMGWDGMGWDELEQAADDQCVGWLWVVVAVSCCGNQGGRAQKTLISLESRVPVFQGAVVGILYMTDTQEGLFGGRSSTRNAEVRRWIGC